jgi:hypothetical protein
MTPAPPLPEAGPSPRKAEYRSEVSRDPEAAPRNAPQLRLTNDGICEDAWIVAAQAEKGR